MWCTSSARSLAATQQLFSHSVLDLAWCPNGYRLFACSYDGTVALLSFEANELGKKASEQDREQTLNRYGLASQRNMIPESVEQLRLEQQHQVTHDESRLDERMTRGSEDIQLGFETPIVKSVPSPIKKLVQAPIVTISPQKQKVTITKDGKKRIQPTFLMK